VILTTVGNYVIGIHCLMQPWVYNLSLCLWDARTNTSCTWSLPLRTTAWGRLPA